MRLIEYLSPHRLIATAPGAKFSRVDCLLLHLHYHPAVAVLDIIADANGLDGPSIGALGILMHIAASMPAITAGHNHLYSRPVRYALYSLDIPLILQ